MNCEKKYDESFLINYLGTSDLEGDAINLYMTLLRLSSNDKLGQSISIRNSIERILNLLNATVKENEDVKSALDELADVKKALEIYKEWCENKTEKIKIIEKENEDLRNQIKSALENFRKAPFQSNFNESASYASKPPLCIYRMDIEQGINLSVKDGVLTAKKENSERENPWCEHIKIFDTSPFYWEAYFDLDKRKLHYAIKFDETCENCKNRLRI